MSPFNPFEEVPSPPFHPTPDQNLSPLPSYHDPFAELRFSDGRIFRIVPDETRICEGEEVRAHYGAHVRWAVELEVQGQGGESSCLGRNDNFWFRILVPFDAIRGGALELCGFPSRCDRPTATLLLARFQVWSYLATSCHAVRFSAHERPIVLHVPPPLASGDCG